MLEHRPIIKSKIQILHYRIINTLSIDISLGAVVGSYFFCLVFGVSPNGMSMLALGLSVWIIYTTDHLLDAKKIKHNPSTFRHQFHRKNFNTFFAFVLVIVIINTLVCVFFLDSYVILLGVLLGGIAIIYLIFQRYLLFAKEMVGAILYTVGVLIPAVGASSFMFTEAKTFLVLQFLLVVFMNLVLFSALDKRNDEHNEQHSIATQWKSTSTTIFIWLIFCLSVMIGIINIFFFSTFSIASFIIMSMAILLAIIQLFQAYFSVHDRFRYVGDAIFFLPLIYLFLV